MRWFYPAAAALSVLAVGVSALGEGSVYALEAAKEKLPPLIQATTLEEDYRAVASLGLALTPLLSEEDFGQAFENILCCCVRIQAKGHYGSGSIFKMQEDEIIIVTNKHLLQYWDEDSYIMFYNGAASQAALLGVSDRADIGFLRVPAGGFSYEELLALRNVRILEEGLWEGENYFSVDMATEPGRPERKDGEVISSLAYLEDFGMEMFYGKGDAVPGMSGSGVFDGYGNYLGMMTGGNLLGEIAAVPAMVIYSEYCNIVGTEE